MRIITYTRTNYYYYNPFKSAAKNKDLSKTPFVFLLKNLCPLFFESVFWAVKQRLDSEKFG